ncbi:MAG TPA: hypothetical protein VLZ81_15350, partial [Blastocatellia bacterium]|nr:hypothetical protein [Blastocatellia bacterium]
MKRTGAFSLILNKVRRRKAGVLGARPMAACLKGSDSPNRRGFRDLMARVKGRERSAKRAILPPLGPAFKPIWCVTVMLIIAAACSVCLGQGPVASEGWVVLPVDEYRALRLAAFPAEATPAPPPVDATLTRVDYDLKVDGDLASGQAHLTVDVIKDGWVQVAIPSGLIVRSATLDGKQVSLVTHPDDQRPGSYLLLSHTGRSVLDLDVVAPVSSVAGTDILHLPVGSSAVSRAAVTLGRLGVDVHITGGLLLETSETASESHWVAGGSGADTLVFAWKRRLDDQRSIQPLRFRAEFAQLVGLGEETTQINADIQVNVLQGVASTVKVQLPDQLTVNQVAGATVADWEVAGRELTVVFIDPVSQMARFTVSGEIKLPRDGHVDVPLIRIPAAERETGGLAVEVLGAGEMKNQQVTGMNEAEAAELGQMIASRQSPSLIAFRLQAGDGGSARSLSVDVARYTPQAVLAANVEEARYTALMTQDGKVLVQSRFAVRNNQRSFLKINLPPNATLWSVLVAGRPLRPGHAPDGSLLLPLEKTRSGDESPAFVVEVTYIDRAESWTDKGHGKLSLLTLDLPISKSSVLLHYSPQFKLTPATGTFRLAPYQAAESSVLQPNYKPQEIREEIAQSVTDHRDQKQADETQALVYRLKE